MTDILTAHELHVQMIAKSAEVDQAVAEYREQALNYAAKKHMSEMDQALARPRVKQELGPKPTVDDVTAAVYRICNQSVLEEYRADALRNGADRALKARMAQLSALQSMAAALREELRLARTDNYSDT